MRDVLWVWKTEWLRLWQNRKARWALLGFLFIPLLYSSLYLYAFWDPYGSLGRLSMAVINEDQGAEVEGEHLSYGQELVQAWAASEEISWQEVTREEAEKGLERGRYSMVVHIPPTFTQDLLSVQSPLPRPARLTFIVNEGANYTLAIAQNSLLGQLLTQIENRYTESFILHLLKLVGTSEEGLTQALLAAAALEENLSGLTEQLEQMSRGLEMATRRLAEWERSPLWGSGLGALQQELQSLAQQAESLSQSISASPGDAGDAAQQLTPQILQQARQQQRWTSQLTELLSAHAATEHDGWVREAVELAQNLHAQSQSLLQSAQSLQQQLDRTAPAAGASQQLRQFSQSVAAAAQQAGRLTQQAEQWREEAQEVASVLRQLALSQQDEEGLSMAEQAANLQEQAASLNESLSQGTVGTQAPAEELSRVIAQPVVWDEKRLKPAGSYGISMAPAFLPMSLWVGALMLYFLLPVRELRWKIGPQPPWAVTLGKFFTLMPFALLQAILTGMAVHLALGLPLAVGWAYYPFLVILSWMSIAAIGCLMSILGNGAGRWTALVLLILQLTSSGGAFPVSLSPGFFQWIHPFLPMTYGVEGLREIIQLGHLGRLGAASLILIAFGVGSLGLWALLQRQRIRPRELRTTDGLEGM